MTDTANNDTHCLTQTDTGRQRQTQTDTETHGQLGYSLPFKLASRSFSHRFITNEANVFIFGLNKASNKASNTASIERCISLHFRLYFSDTKKMH